MSRMPQRPFSNPNLLRIATDLSRELAYGQRAGSYHAPKPCPWPLFDHSRSGTAHVKHGRPCPSRKKTRPRSAR